MRERTGRYDTTSKNETKINNKSKKNAERDGFMSFSV